MGQAGHLQAGSRSDPERGSAIRVVGSDCIRRHDPRRVWIHGKKLWFFLPFVGFAYTSLIRLPT